MDFELPYLEEADEKDLNVKAKEKINEDNFVFDLFKDDHNKFIDFIEQGEDFSHQEKIMNDENDLIIKKIDLPKQMQKDIWSSFVPTFISYYNESIENPENKIII